MFARAIPESSGENAAIATLLAPSERVIDHPSCIHCGYDLRTLDITAYCPECNTAVAESRRFGRLWEAERGWVLDISAGAYTLAVSSAVLTVLAWLAALFALVASHLWFLAAALVGGATLFMALPLWIGSLRVAEREPQSPLVGAERKWRMLHLALCMSPVEALLWLLLAFCMTDAGWGAPLRALMIMLLWSLLGLYPGLVALRLSSLVRRAQAASSARFARRAALLLVLLMIGGGVAHGVGGVWLPSLLAPRPVGAVSSRSVNRHSATEIPAPRVTGVFAPAPLGDRLVLRQWLIRLIRVTPRVVSMFGLTALALFTLVAVRAAQVLCTAARRIPQAVDSSPPTRAIHAQV